ncbi:RNA-dependent RNA polymerase [Verticillium dahliae chrysovirus 1]|uniref:RNA-directed RNA polymerase n=1 Tax=Verticillium dahliae chrysovirus 1 TaxID=759389 RepID=D6QSQ3_9VIRU|nr:RNA-dependent RNA polymerase [Verticillium dahliae chrysovirus 1]ADG21213.1 RNA-dependent RNA polymerase [Verticillium dahliae chrysovirus 1]
MDLRQRQERARLNQGTTVRSATRAARHGSNHGVVPLIRQTENAFASSKAGAEYQQRLESSMSRYRVLREQRSNLFAIIMPAGHGKTHYAKRYGFVDVDDLVAPRLHNELVDMRYAAMHGRSTWTKHNDRWVGAINKTLDLFDYSEPVVVLLHHEETALEIGAIILGGFRLKQTTFKLNISSRTADDRFFSETSYRSFDDLVATPNKIDNLDNQNLERLLIKTMCVNNLAVACPHKYERNQSQYYKQSCPEWVLQGKPPIDRDIDMAELVRLYDSGIIPRQAVDYYVNLGYTTTSLDFGVTLNDWGPVMAQVADGIGEPQDFDVNGDMVEIFPPREPKELSRANVTMRRLDETFAIWEHSDVYDMCSFHVGEPHVFVSGLVTAWKGLMVKLKYAHLVAPWFCVSYDHWTKAMKAVHTLVRTSRFLMSTEITEDERQSLMYLDLLIGRTTYVINEMAEVDKRGGDHYSSDHLSYDPRVQLFTKAQYREDFNTAIKTAYTRMRYTKQPRLRVQSFRDFYLRRKEWLTKGSLVYNHIPSSQKRTVVQALDSINNVIVELEARHNKQSLFEEMDLKDFLKLVGDAKDFNVTKTMVKYETGKKDRTLLPGSLIHFFTMTYVLELAERLEQVGSARLKALPDDDFIWFDRKMVNGLYHVLYDWADFNEQHSADEMAAVIAELEHTVEGPSDYAYFVQAVSSSMYDMQLQDREGKRHKLWKGLFSGWRGTTWINTVLNFCYSNIALMNYQRLYGEDPVVYVDQGGDDIDSALDNAPAMGKFMAIMDNMLFNANAWKQMFSTRTEFFRNTITSGRAYASPTRALASFCAGDWEGSGNMTMGERVINILDQVGKLTRRGLDQEFGNGLVLCALTHWCKLRKEDSWVNMPAEVIHGQESQGGLGVPDWNGCVWELETDVPCVKDTWMAVLKPSKLSSNDYVEELAKDLDALSLELVRREELATRLAEDAYDVELKLDKLNWQTIIGFRTKVLSKRPVVEYRREDKLFDDFMHFRVSDEMIRKYTDAARFSELAGHVCVNGRELSKTELVDIMGDGRVRLEALDFKGNPHYRRLVPDFMGRRATFFCKEAINSGAADEEVGQYVFETICYMAREVFGHSM